MLAKIAEEIENYIRKEFGLDVKLEEPPDVRLGDFAVPPILLTKVRNPKLIVEKLMKCKVIKHVKVEENGYVNIFVDFKEFAYKILEKILKEKKNYGKGTLKKKIIIEFSSPNPVHAIHIGTARNTFIGEAMARILEKAGCNVERWCYINDMGRQVAILTYGYMKLDGKPEGKTDHWLSKLYVKANEIADEQAIYDILRKYEEGDEKIKKTMRWLVNLCLDGFKQTYARIGVKFDVYKWESEFLEDARKIVRKLEDMGYVKEEDGAKVFEEDDLRKVLIRKDGTTLYLTRDVAFAIYKMQRADEVINVIGAEQELLQNIVRRILEILGYAASKYHHLKYAHVNLEGTKMSARKGIFVSLDELLDEAIKRAKELSRNNEAAEKVGLGAIKYFMLRTSAEKGITFSWRKALNFEENTGPYVQYACVRAKSILRNANETPEACKPENLNDYERVLLKLFAKYPSVILEAAEKKKPHLIANYAFELAKTFNLFYRDCPVIKSDERTRKFRLAVVKCFEIIVEDALNLLGIAVPERM